jgi:hypothetical protein
MAPVERHRTVQHANAINNVLAKIVFIIFGFVDNILTGRMENNKCYSILFISTNRSLRDPK